ncbi:MAG: hypothetical protein P3T54_02485 [Dehalogenimonas sp.]|uniref:ECF transporter S component n=1 Tax=Candidatus Dehalogenimonas loeffleri TaxID=3127115 RepID=A0ABZ2J504_9CHLR|nr:hypothetical protein [Dehalogenimonas sp.]
MIKPIAKRTFKSFAGMLLAGAFTGFLIAIPGIVLGAALVSGNDAGGFGDLVGGIMGMVFGYPLGAVLGIWIYGRVFKYPGSIWLALAGAVMGVVLIFGLAEPLNLNADSNVLLLSYFTVTVVLASWGYHLKAGKNS